MRASCSKLFLSVWLLMLVACLTTADDQTMTAGATGADVVEQTCNIITAHCIFPEDKIMTRRMAYTESSDGMDPWTFRTGYYGGIWQVNQSMFDLTQSDAARPYLTPIFVNITQELNIVWSSIKWEDLTVPMYSALGARLYMHYESRAVQSVIPRAIEDQSVFWTSYYHPYGDTGKYEKDAYYLANECSNRRGSDLIFVLDSSGSIGIDNFKKVLEFVKDVINATDIGMNKTRVGVISYSNAVRTEFHLNTYDNKEDMIAHVDTIVYMNSGTNTDLGLDEMTNNGFTTVNGARDLSEGYPRVGIIVTDGQSNNPTKTIASANKAKNASITVFAVGVTSGISLPELEVIASEPTCYYLLILETFTEVDSLKYAIEQGICEAPIVLSETEDSNTVGSLLPRGNQNCKIKVRPGGTTIKLGCSGGSTTFYISEKTYPSSAYYDKLVHSRPDKMGVMYIPHKASWGPEVVIYCNIRNDNQTRTNFAIGQRQGNQDLCGNLPCGSGECFDDGKTYTCSSAIVTSLSMLSALVALFLKFLLQ